MDTDFLVKFDATLTPSPTFWAFCIHTELKSALFKIDMGRSLYRDSRCVDLRASLPSLN
jgi:hypothetical protein